MVISFYKNTNSQILKLLLNLTLSFMDINFKNNGSRIMKKLFAKRKGRLESQYALV